jgi:hypothetical protein
LLTGEVSGPAPPAKLRSWPARPSRSGATVESVESYGLAAALGLWHLYRLAV